MNRNTAQENIKVAKSKDPITVTASFNSTGVDTAGYETAQAIVYYGLSGDTLSGSVNFSCKIQHSTDNITFVDVPAANIVGSTTNVFAVCNAAADDNALYTLGCKDFNRYLRVVCTVTGSMTYGTPMCVLFNLADAGHADVGNTVQGS